MAAAIGLVAVWQLGVQLLAIPDYLLPGPRAVAATVVSERTLIFQHGLITLYEAGLGFTLALVFAVPISAIIVWSKVAEKTVLPLMVFLQTVPKVAIAPLFIIWFGFGPFPKVLISFLLAYFPIVIEMVTGLRDVNPTVLDLARSMSITPFQTFTKIRIPNSLPYLFSGLKLGALLSLVGAIVAEFMGSMVWGTSSSMRTTGWIRRCALPCSSCSYSWARRCSPSWNGSSGTRLHGMSSFGRTSRSCSPRRGTAQDEEFGGDGSG